MSEVLEFFNHLLGVWLQARGHLPGVTLHRLTLEPEGARLAGRLEHPLARGDFALRLQVAAPREGRQRLHLSVEQWPEHLPEGLEPFRRLLETARLHLELDAPP